MRRTTLGAVNNGNQGRPSTTGRERKSLGVRARPPTATGTRTSFGSGRPSYGGGRPSTSGANARGAGGRMSLAGNSRRSSQYGNEAGYSQMKDTRPLTDKGYQHKCIRTLMEFLVEHDYPHTVSSKILSVPTNKCFLQVFEFLYKFIDPDENIRVQIAKRPEEEIPKILKRLRYPFNISKSQMLNVGSPHAWPMILGSLMWLLDMIIFAFPLTNHVEDTLFGDKEDENGAEFFGTFHKYLENSYEAFLRGAELNELGSYDEEFYRTVRAENEVAKQELENLQAENVALEEAFKRLSADSSQLEALNQKRQLLQSDREKFAKYIEELSHHKKLMVTQKSKVESELEIARLENEALIAESHSLQDALNNQELSAGDVERLKREIQDFTKRLESLEKEKTDLDQKIWENEIAQAKVNSEVEVCVAEYTNIGRTLKIIPETAENSLGMNLAVKFNPHSQSQSDPTSNMKTGLQKVKAHITSRTHLLESQYLTELDRAEQINDQIQEKTDEVAALESKISHSEEEIERSKQVFEDKYSKLAAQVETKQKNIEEVKTRVKNSKEETEEDLLEYKKMVDGRITEMKKEKNDFRGFLMDVCTVIINHKSKIQNCIADLKEETLKDLEEAKAMEIPRSELLEKFEMEKTKQV